MSTLNQKLWMKHVGPIDKTIFCPYCKACVIYCDNFKIVESVTHHIKGPICCTKCYDKHFNNNKPNCCTIL